MRAQVKYIGLPRSPRDLYRVGVELETPANIWGIKSPPQDWRPSSAKAVVATRATALPPAEAISSGTIALALEGSTEAGQPVRVLVSTDQILSALAIKLQQEAEKAMALALTHRLEAAVTAAVKNIEVAAQMRLRTIEERVPPRDGILGRLKAILTKLSRRLRTP